MSRTGLQRDRGRAAAALTKGLGEAARLHQAGRLDDAARCYSAVLAADPRHFETLHRFGVLRAQQGKFDEAVDLLRRAVGRDPASAPAHNNLGMTLNLAERQAEAVAPLERAVALDPKNPIAHNNFGNALRALGRRQPAAAMFERAVALNPDYVEALSNFGATLHEAGRTQQAIPLLERALALNPGFAQAHFNLGIALHALDRNDEAMACFERALVADPRNIQVHAQIAGIHLETGRLGEARRWYLRALAIQPRNARILYDIVQSAKVGADDPHLATLESLAENVDALPEDQRISLQFALAKAYADLGENARGFRHLQDGCALQRRRLPYDEVASLGLFERIRTVFSEELMESRTNLGNPSERPIFILGMMRSGSTLVEQVLAAHPEIFAAGELPYFNHAYEAVRATVKARGTYPDTIPSFSGEQLRRIGDEYVARIEPLAAGRRATRITDKMPGNFSAIGLIRLALPNARIIHTVRDPIDTCLSCYSKLFSDPQPFTYDVGELGRYYRGYARLMAHWRDILPAGSMIEVRYEDLVGDFDSQVRRIIDYCGLEWNDACLSFWETDRPVRTASQVQVRQPLYNSSVRRWRPDPETLRPLLEGLGVIETAG
jgi:tetratricopeptide (TPR) repeat protein